MFLICCEICNMYLKIHLQFFTCPHKFKSLLCTDKQVLNASLKDFWYINMNNHHNTNFKHFCLNKSDAKITSLNHIYPLRLITIHELLFKTWSNLQFIIPMSCAPGISYQEWDCVALQQIHTAPCSTWPGIAPSKQ